MIPVRTSSIFKSRWIALIWAAGIVWAAYDFAGTQPQDNNSSGDNSQQAEAALNAF